jgi:MFS family permease
MNVGDAQGGTERGLPLLALFYGRTVSFLLRMAIPPFIPFFVEEFKWSSFEVGVLASAYLWSYALAQPFWGPVIDKWGGKKSLVVGWIITVVSSAAFALGSSLDQLVSVRLLFGIGAASVLVASVVIVEGIYGPEERGLPIGVLGSSSSIGTLLAGISVPWLLVSGVQLASLSTWRSVLMIITIPAVLALLMFVWVPSRPKRRMTLAKVGIRNPTHSKGEVVRDWRLYAMSVAMVGYLVGFTVVSTWIYIYLHQEYGLSNPEAGTVGALAIFAPGIFGPLLSGWLSDRLGVRARVAAAGALLSALSMFTLIFSLPLYLVVFVLVFYGTFSLFHTPVFQLPAETWSVQVSGTALSVIAGFAQVGAAITPVVSGYLLSQTGSYDVIWLMGSVTYVGAAATLLAIREKRA